MSPPVFRVEAAPPARLRLERGAPGVRYELRPTNGGGKPTSEELPPFVGTGKVSLQYERVLGNSSAGQIKIHPAPGKLATDKLEPEVKDAKQPKSEKPDQE